MGLKFKNKEQILRIWNRTIVSIESKIIDKSIKKFNRVYKFVYKWFVRCEKWEFVSKSEISPMWVLIYGLKDPISHKFGSKYIYDIINTYKWIFSLIVLRNYYNTIVKCPI
jgi:hypothetical protein